MRLELYTTAFAWVLAAAAMRFTNAADPDAPASWCFTYLSDILVPVPTRATRSFPTITETPAGLSNPTSEPRVPLEPSSVSRSPLPSSSLVLSRESLTTTSGPEIFSTSSLGTLATSEPGTLDPTPLGNSTTSAPRTSLTFGSETTATASSSPTPSIPEIRQVILFISPSIGPRRYIRKRASTGFLNTDEDTSQQRCDNATIFTLASGELSENNGVPVYYSPGDNYKQLRSTISLPDGVSAITTTFADNEGILEFSNSSLPGGRATFCEDDVGNVYITFTSSPPSCEPVLLTTYGGE